jgi:aminoglycoside phosphotransferase
MNIESLQKSLPKALAEAVVDCYWQQVFTGYSTSRVFRLLRANHECLYLKVDFHTFDRDLKQEKLRLEWLRGRLPVPQVRMFLEGEGCDYLLLSEVPGIPASDDACKKDPAKVIEQLSAGLAMIHGLPINQCPFNETLEYKVEQARQRMIKGMVDESDFDKSRLGRTASELYQELIERRPADEELVFTHGDYCLPNIIVNDWQLSGLIDWGRAGIADWHQDIALFARSVEGNFGEKWVEQVYSACRIKPDPAKIYFYTLLDEFF